MVPDTQRVRCSRGGRKDRRWTQSPSGRHLRTSRLGSFCSDAGPKKNRNVCKRGFPNARTRCVCRALRPARRPGAFDAIDLELTAKKVVIVWGERKRRKEKKKREKENCIALKVDCPRTNGSQCGSYGTGTTAGHTWRDETEARGAHT